MLNEKINSRRQKHTTFPSMQIVKIYTVGNLYIAQHENMEKKLRKEQLDRSHDILTNARETLCFRVCHNVHK